jgi:thiol:disulfide interchange protein
MNHARQFALRLFPAILFLLATTISPRAHSQPAVQTDPAAAKQNSQPATKAILDQAEAAAVAQHKNVLLVFSASWCGPCHMFEAMLTDPNAGPIIDKYFVIGRLDVGEKEKDTHHANTPGAVAYMASLKGADAGYPFIVFLDPTGKPIVNSIRPTSPNGTGENIGYPALPVEIDWFMKMMHQGAPGISSKEGSLIDKWLHQRGHS